MKVTYRSLKRHVAELVEKVAKLESEVAALKAIDRANRHIDLVDFHTMRTFMYTDDLAYRQLPERQRRFTPDDHRPIPVEKRTPGDLFASPASSAFEIMMAHYWLHDLDFTYFDVGAQYCTGSVHTARIIEGCGKPNRVVAFEPGVAAQLAPFNIAINHQSARITFERMAVSRDDFPALLFAEAGHSENNRIVNRTPDQELMSVLVPCTSIDGYVESRGIEGNLILKIDTQGGEYEVVEGMRRTMARRFTAFLTEFTPWALETRINPAEWVQSMLRENYVLDTNIQTGLSFGAGQGITADRVGNLVESVMRSEQKYTDLAVIPRRLPGAEKLIDRLRQ